METPKRLRLFATAIALQQMQGQSYAQFFLEDQGIDKSEARKLTCWAAYVFAQTRSPEFGHEFQRALVQLLHLTEFAEHSLNSNEHPSRSYAKG